MPIRPASRRAVVLLTPSMRWHGARATPPRAPALLVGKITDLHHEHRAAGRPVAIATATASGLSCLRWRRPRARSLRKTPNGYSRRPRCSAGTMPRCKGPKWRQRITDWVWVCEEFSQSYNVLPTPLRLALTLRLLGLVSNFSGDQGQRAEIRRTVELLPCLSRTTVGSGIDTRPLRSGRQFRSCPRSGLHAVCSRAFAHRGKSIPHVNPCRSSRPGRWWASHRLLPSQRQRDPHEVPQAVDPHGWSSAA